MARLIQKLSQKLVEVLTVAAAKTSRQVSRWRGKRICLGITGLSQSGKSTFITSLINQVLNFETAGMSAFPPFVSGRLLGAKVFPLSHSNLDLFPYEESYQRIASSEPKWPESTHNTSGCVIEFRLARTGGKYNPFKSKHYSLYLEIRDYPGEWLLDLPLREMTFRDWCAQCTSQFNEEPRRSLLGDRLGELQHIDPLKEADLDHLSQLNQRFKSFLHECKYNGKSLSLIQPGRFLIPGDIDDPSVLGFIPLLKCGSYSEKQLDKANKRSYFKVCEKLYKRYLKELVEPFYSDHFRRIDRQLVLVDVVRSLNSGEAYLNDMKQALTKITDSFAYGNSSFISRKVDRVVFAATKIDQVLSEDHEAVRQLLATVVHQAYKDSAYEGVEPVCEATAAVRSSHEVNTDKGRAISGFDENGKSIGYVHPTIPSRIPEGNEWQPFMEWKIPSLRPPHGISHLNNDNIPHIRMDSILNGLIGDKCV
jgi:uncharacterized protein